MIPRTKNGMNSFECISAMQKHIRRGEEEKAVHFALEMAMSSTAFCTRVLNRLIVIAQEDVGLGDMATVTYVLATVEGARQIRSKGQPNRANVSITNAVMALSRAQKSRSGNWLSAISADKVQRGEKPEIEDWVLDKHTAAGKRMGRGFEHFISNLKLVPSPHRPEKYERQGIAVRRRQEAETKGGGDLFDER